MLQGNMHEKREKRFLHSVIRCDLNKKVVRTGGCSAPDILFAVIGVVGLDGMCAEQLFGDQRAHQHMRPGGFAQ